MGVDYGDVVQYPPSTEELDTRFKVGKYEAVQLILRVVFSVLNLFFIGLLVRLLLVLLSRGIALGYEGELASPVRIW